MVSKTIIGRVERIRFSISPQHAVPAKIDSGADISSVWATDITETADGLQFRLFGPKSPCYTGDVITIPKGDYRATLIANSFDTKERRYVVSFEIEVLGRTVVSEFTLANRSTKIYPILLGRSLLQQEFLVDVTKGEPLLEAERSRLAKMHVELSEREE
jgi:hypothetical protein